MRSGLWRAAFCSSCSIPMSIDKAMHDRVLNWAAVMMWPTLAPQIRELMDKEAQKQAKRQ